jgi:hypothetical protein
MESSFLIVWAFMRLNTSGRHGGLPYKGSTIFWRYQYSKRLPKEKPGFSVTKTRLFGFVFTVPPPRMVIEFSDSEMHNLCRVIILKGNEILKDMP